MKVSKMLFLMLVFGSFFSCEDVVDVELEEAEPRLVIEASLLWDIDDAESEQYVVLTTTAPFFDDEIPAAKGASVSVFDETGNEYLFEETEDGIFKNDKIDPVLNSDYRLHINYQGEVYEATEQFIPTPEILYVEQENNGGFTGDDIELKIFYQDPGGMENYYLFRFFEKNLSLQIYDDRFTDGSRNFAYYSAEDLESGDQVGLEIQGISEGFYEYMYILRSQAGSSNGGPFQTQPTTVRGNIVNITNPENFAFGYFRLSATDFMSYTVE
ncbi:MAG: DUF4249 domain-containing protein [Salinimicrobium sp.]